ncbi:MAG: FprA family A-type flavoprotein [Desulfurococcaceae archaeon]
MSGTGAAPREIASGVYWVGVNDRNKKLFEAVWPIPHGISYNAYAVVGERGVALIDAVDEPFADEYLGKVKEVVGDLDRVKYLVANHLEPDHHGATPLILEKLRDAKLVVSPMASRIAPSLYRLASDRLIQVGDGEAIDLGGKTLRFLHLPWLHWPETMATLDVEDSILFSCDAFGSYGALEGGIFDDEVDLDFYLAEARRYFSNIVAKYSRNVLIALEKVKRIAAKIIAPSHGPVYRQHANRILELYERWAKPEPERDRVLLVYGSMYGRARALAESLARRLEDLGMRVVVQDASTIHPSYVLSELVEARTLVLVYATYDAGIFPPIEWLLYLVQLKELGRGRNAALVNAYSWGPTSKIALEYLQRAGFRVIEPVVETKALPDERAMEEIARLAEAVASAR